MLEMMRLEFKESTDVVSTINILQAERAVKNNGG